MSSELELKISDLIKAPTCLFGQLSIVNLDTSASGNISGIIASPEFNSKDQTERQKELWDYLAPKLSPEERIKITAILTLTPEEIGEDEEVG